MRGVSTTMKQVTAEQALAASGEELASGNSPTVATMLEWTLTWSDNLLAERFARLASRAAGNKFDDAGVAKTFTQMFNELGISDPKIQISDASGLSKKNRVSARTIAELLAKIRNESTYATVFKGLPVSGITGTLENRYITTAPQAVGLIHAKTGTLNGTMSLAGYVEAGDREYIFVTFADRIPKSTRAENLARITLDKAIAKLASPLINLPKFQTTMIETLTAN
jgi:PBP4 family serine-type D-alanyl-D-alanine carboxypeptidase